MRIAFASICILLSFFTLPAFAGGVQEPETTTETEAVSDTSFTVTDSRGKAVSFDQVPGRIVSIAPSNTEILFAVGGGDRVVGVTEWCNYPEEATTREKVGGFSAKTLSVEKVISLNPDVVVGDRSMHEEVAAVFENAGIPVVLLETKDFDQMYGNILIAGLITGHGQEAQDLVDSLTSRVQKIADKVGSLKSSEKKRVFWEIYDDPLMTAGVDTFIGQLITAAGGISIFSDVEGSWPQVSTEELISRDPDVIISSNSHGGELKKEDVIARPGWDQLTAIRNDELYLIGEDKVSRPGPRLIDGLEEVARILYPELF